MPEADDLSQRQQAFDQQRTRAGVIETNLKQAC